MATGGKPSGWELNSADVSWRWGYGVKISAYSAPSVTLLRAQSRTPTRLRTRGSQHSTFPYTQQHNMHTQKNLEQISSIMLHKQVQHQPLQSLQQTNDEQGWYHIRWFPCCVHWETNYKTNYKIIKHAYIYRQWRQVSCAGNGKVTDKKISATLINKINKLYYTQRCHTSSSGLVLTLHLSARSWGIGPDQGSDGRSRS